MNLAFIYWIFELSIGNDLLWTRLYPCLQLLYGHPLGIIVRGIHELLVNRCFIILREGSDDQLLIAGRILI